MVVVNMARSDGSIKELFVLIADNTDLMAGGSEEKIFTFVLSTIGGLSIWSVLDREEEVEVCFRVVLLGFANQ